jgi:SET domain-containing protein
MLLIPVRADRSPIHGLGVFTLHPIPAGTPVWRFQPGFDQRFPSHLLTQLPEPAQRHIHHYAYLDAASGDWILNGDLAVFLNHSCNPNTGCPKASNSATQTIALRDIQTGEELTCDYHAFDASRSSL